MIEHYGWTDTSERDFQTYAARGLIPGRVTRQLRGFLQLVTRQGELISEMSGRFVRQAGLNGFPVVGDWVACQPDPAGRKAVVQALLPRFGLFTRKAAGTSQAIQAVAANVDLAMLVCALNEDINLRRLERYLAMTWESGAEPLVVLTKSDFCADVDAAVATVNAIAIGVGVCPVSAVTEDGLAQLATYLRPCRTAVLLGNSGAGKSTLVNALAGEELMATGAIRARDGRGRHTTTHRELFRIASGALLLDTPGIKELGLIDAEEGLTAVFEDLERDIAEITAGCRYRNCSHTSEPGCAVQQALESGQIDGERWANLKKLRKEMASTGRRSRLSADRYARKRAG